MKKTITYIVSILIFLSLTSVKAQVLFSEDFESYNLGASLNNKNGWVVNDVYNAVRVVSEPGRGKVLAWGWNTMPLTNYGNAGCGQGSFGKPDPGNDVFKLEFDFCSRDFTGAPAELFQSIVGFKSNDFYFRCRVDAKGTTIDSSITQPNSFSKTYNHTWIKVEVYFVYLEKSDSWEVYTYIPDLNYWSVVKRATLSSEAIYLGFSVGKANQSYSGVLIKYDNIKLTAIPNLPVLDNLNEWLSTKFNLYPNPATSIVNITNKENMLVNQITIYDINGKRLSDQNFNNKQDIQLNVENLASGTYMLHLQTNQGTAVKKLVKK